jgi:hypothetical protein
MRCLGCQYDLANLSEHRCPECGREFDPTNPDTFAEHHPFPFVAVAIRLVVGGLLGWAAMVMALLLESRARGFFWSNVLQAALVAFVSVGFLYIVALCFWLWRRIQRARISQ